MAPEPVRKKIFILGEEPEMQIFLCNLLRTQGFQPMISGGECEVYQEVIDEEPDLIIIDVIRYRDSNILLYRTLKADQKLKNIPVIMLSTIDRRTCYHYLKCKRSVSGRSLPEPEAFLIKPPEADELLQLVHSLTKTGECFEDTQEWV